MENNISKLPRNREPVMNNNMKLFDRHDSQLPVHEYHIMFRENSNTISSGNSGFFIGANSISQAKHIAEKHCPRSQYTITDIEPIR